MVKKHYNSVLIDSSTKQGMKVPFLWSFTRKWGNHYLDVVEFTILQNGNYGVSKHSLNLSKFSKLDSTNLSFQDTRELLDKLISNTGTFTQVNFKTSFYCNLLEKSYYKYKQLGDFKMTEEIYSKLSKGVFLTE